MLLHDGRVRPCPLDEGGLAQYLNKKIHEAETDNAEGLSEKKKSTQRCSILVITGRSSLSTTNKIRNKSRSESGHEVPSLGVRSSSL